MIVNGKLLRQRREQLGVSQGQLAEGICHQSLVSRLEKSNHITSMTILQNICARLQIDVSTVVTLKDQEHMPLNVIRELINSNELLRADAYLQSKRFKRQLPEFALPEYHLLKGKIALGLERFAEAMQHLQLALSDVGHHQHQLLIEIFTEMGATWLLQKEIVNATECLERAKAIIRTLSDAQVETMKVVIAHTYRRQAELYVSVGNAKKSLHRIKEAMALLPADNVFHELLALQQLRLRCAEMLKLDDDKKEALVLAYAAAKFSKDQRLNDIVKNYQAELWNLEA